MNHVNFEALVNLAMLSALFAALALWWLTKRGGKRGRIAERVRAAATAQRSDAMMADAADEDIDLRTRILRRLAKIGDHIPLFDAKHRQTLQQELVRGGYRSNSAVSIMIAAKFSTGIVCAVAVVVLGSKISMIENHPSMRAILMLFVFIIGMIIPEYIFKFRAARRRSLMSSSLPDALDLLVICTNAGNSLGVSIRRVADELASICPPLSDEFSLTADELKLSGDSTRALANLAGRIDLPSIRALMSTLTQSMRYGTPISQALRTLSRTERLAHIVSLEEKAAKLAPKMVVPMMLFILPPVVAISAGPAVIQLLAFIAKK